MDENVTYAQGRRSNIYLCPDGCPEDKSFPFHLPRSVALAVARIPAPQKSAKKNVVTGFFSNGTWDSSQKAGLLKESENQGS